MLFLGQLAPVALAALGCLFVIFGNSHVIGTWAESKEQSEPVLFAKVWLSTARKMGILGLVLGLIVTLSSYLDYDDAMPEATPVYCLIGAVLGAFAGFFPGIAAIWGSYYSPRKSMLLSALVFVGQIQVVIWLCN